MKGIKSCFSLFLGFSLFAGAAAEGIMPSSPVTVEEGAFEGCGFESVILSGDTVSVEDRAFADCTSLRSVTIPSTVASVAETAFEGCGEDLLILTDGEGAALDLALSQGFDYGGGTVRVVIASETYDGDPYHSNLYGTATDARGFRDMFASWERTEGNITLLEDPDRDTILQSISSGFAGAGSLDISVFVFAGHGTRDSGTGTSSLIAYRDTQGISAAALRNAFSGIGGRKVIIIDACYSGGLISDETTVNSEEELSAGAKSFVSGFIGPFVRLTSRSALTADGFFIMTACSDSQLSYETQIISGGSEAYAGLFSYNFNCGCGWNEVTGERCDAAADQNGNGIVALGEIEEYVSGCVSSYQTVMMYPSGNLWFGLFRND